MDQTIVANFRQDTFELLLYGNSFLFQRRRLAVQLPVHIIDENTMVFGDDYIVLTSMNHLQFAQSSDFQPRSTKTTGKEFRAIRIEKKCLEE